MKLSELIKILKKIQKEEDDLSILRKNFCSHYGEEVKEVEEIILDGHGGLIFK